jgi:hypothetical protein
MGVLTRRDFFKGALAAAAATAVCPNALTPSVRPKHGNNLRDRVSSLEFPLGYDPDNFGSAERVFFEAYNRAYVNVFVRPGKVLDVKLYAASTKSGLSRKSPLSLVGMRDSVDIYMGQIFSPEFHYKIEYKDGKTWKSLEPRSVKAPNFDMQNGGKVKIVLKGDDHVYADLKHEPTNSEWRRDVLRGDYIGQMLNKIIMDPDYRPEFGTRKVAYGFALAHTIKYILETKPDLVVDLGDTVGTDSYGVWGSRGQWPELQPMDNFLTQARILWERKRRTISAITPEIPFYQTLGNHDGEVGWFTPSYPFTQPYSREQRKRLLREPTPLTQIERVHVSSGITETWYLNNWDQNFFSVFWSGGDIRLLILDVNSYLKEKPNKITDWTLGERQKAVTESVLYDGLEVPWKFICFHNTVGGYPLGSKKSPGAYGRGPLFNREDYERINHIDPSQNINPDDVEQVWLTETAADTNVRGFFYGHDHIFFAKDLGKTAQGKSMIGACVGGTTYSGALLAEKIWSNPYWMDYYGAYYDTPPPFLTTPGITELEIDKKGMTVRYVCTAPLDIMHTNMPMGTKPGDILREYRLSV